MPDSLFIPGKKLMFKIMRACAQTNGDKDKLWYRSKIIGNTEEES